MHLDTLQQLRVEQKLKLAPRMIQSMEILQLPLLALEERIAQELEKNPLLETQETDPDAVKDMGDENSVDQESTTATDEAEGERDLVVSDDGDNQEDFDRLDVVEEVMLPDAYTDVPRPTRVGVGEDDPKMQALANTAAREISLHEYLDSQFGLIDDDTELSLACRTIIDNIDPDGYLKTDFEELLVESGLPSQIVDSNFWNKALKLVQQLDPPGVAARSPQECFLLQINAFAEDRPVETDIIANYFDELQHQEFQKISRKSGYTIEQIKGVVEFIRTRLVLHPGLAFGSSQAPFIIPDVIVDYDEDLDIYTVSVPESSSPRLHISGQYRQMLQNPGVDAPTRKFIRNNMQSAQWLIDAVEQRRETLRKVAQSIVEHQKEFLDNGPRFLRPLPMAEVADEVGVHLATVSRAVAEKYILTPRGIFALRSFFSGGKETSDGESVSYDAIREKIKDIVEAEDKTAPLNDDDIKAKLEESGITVARRTVAKYRKLLNIPSSHKRREK